MAYASIIDGQFTSNKWQHRLEKGDICTIL